MSEQSADELEKMIQQQLEQMKTQYVTMSNDVLGKIDSLSSKIDTLQDNLTMLLEQAEMDNAALAQHNDWQQQQQTMENQ